MEFMNRLKSFQEKVVKNSEKKSSFPMFMTTWSQVKTSQDYNLVDLTNEGYRKNAIASACISMIATSAPEAPLKVYRMTSEGEIEITNHWLSQVIQRPNWSTSSYEMWELVHTYLNTAGNAYIYLKRENEEDPLSPVIEMHVLRPDCVNPVSDRHDQIRYFQYSKGGEMLKLEPYQVLHLKFPDPLNEVEGLSPLVRIYREIGIDNMATDFTKTFFDNSAIPFGIISTDQRLREEETERTREKWMQWFGGRKGKNRFKPAVLGQGMKYEQIGLDFQQMEFEALRSMTETRICGAFGVDPVLLPSWVGIKYGGKYSNYSEARYHLWEETIIPALTRIASKITSQLLVHEGLVARFDLSEVQALKESVDLKFTRVGTAFEKGIVKLNEARTQLGFEQDTQVGDQYKFQLDKNGGTPLGMSVEGDSNLTFTNEE